MVGGKELFAPEGFRISIYATGIKGARFFSFAPDGTMFVGSNTGDSIYAIPNNNGSAGTPVVIEDNLNTPHSVYYYNGDLYLAEQIRVSVYRGIKSDGTYNSKEVLVDNLPGGNKLTGGGHTTRTVVIGPDNKMYVSVGSSCNVCIEDDNRRAAIMRYNLDGTGGEIYASGLRNTVGFSFNDGKLWGLDMGRDQIGDDIPPEEVNIIEQGKNYGWPYCYGDKINNPEYKDKAEYCKTQTQAPVLGLQAHYAPLGIAFENEAAMASWPSVFSSGFFGAMHGSWNRTVPTGYKVIWVDTKSSPMKEYNFITGWLDGSGAWGRPVGVGFDPAGNMYISDDKQNLIYKVQYQ
jgi:glucose/arabinose dehydrogenase